MALVVNNEFSVEGLMEAMVQYLEAKRVHDEARDGYTGYSWDYAGQFDIERMEAARDEFNVKLDEYIENKVNAILAPRSKSFPAVDVSNPDGY